MGHPRLRLFPQKLTAIIVDEHNKFNIISNMIIILIMIVLQNEWYKNYNEIVLE
jgi:hypothetical protein